MLWFKQFVVFLDKRMERIIVLEAVIDIIVKHIEDLDDAEEGRIAIRNIRRDVIEIVKDDELPERVGVLYLGICALHLIKV